MKRRRTEGSVGVRGGYGRCASGRHPWPPLHFARGTTDRQSQFITTNFPAPASRSLKALKIDIVS